MSEKIYWTSANFRERTGKICKFIVSGHGCGWYFYVVSQPASSDGRTEWIYDSNARTKFYLWETGIFGFL